MEKKSYIAIASLVLILGLPRIGSTNPITINFDETIGEIGNYYQSLGVEFFRGDSQYGASVSTVGSAWAYKYVDAAVSEPNVLVPLPGNNNDIFAFFYDKSLKRTSAQYIQVQNDRENHPNHIVLVAFDISNKIIQSVDIYGGGGSGSIEGDNIWYAMIYSAPGTEGLLGVDNFKFNLSSVPEPSALFIFATSIAGLFCSRERTGVNMKIG